MEARLAFSLAVERLDALGPSAISVVAREKERVIRQSQVLDYYEPDAKMNDVGGLETLKLWLERRGSAFGAGARDFGLDSPKGVLLLGVQGCGKSLVAKAVANAWQFHLLRLDMGKVFGGIVGQSEANVRTALQVAQALAPCVLWIDEIEKALGSAAGSTASDGGLSRRMFGTMLTWMQERTAPVFVVATANAIDDLPPELMRKGRFDEIFFVDLPGDESRRAIFDLHLRKRGRDPSRFDLARLVASSAGFSGAEIEQVVIGSLLAAFDQDREVKQTDLHHEIEASVPLSVMMAEEIDELRTWARLRARPAAKRDE